MSGWQDWLWAARRGLDVPEPDPHHHALATPARLHCVPFSSPPASNTTAMSPRQGHHASGGHQVKQALARPGRADARHREHPTFLPSHLLSPPPDFPPCRILAFIQPLPTSHPPISLLGFPSCNLQLLSPPPPGLRDTKGFALPHRHHVTRQASGHRQKG